MRRRKISDKGVRSDRRPVVCNNWPPVTSHTLEPTPLSEIFLVRIQGYSWPCSKLRDTFYNTLWAFLIIVMFGSLVSSVVFCKNW
jgi:hypothetical protein